jgi:hypothetical protein
MVAWTRLSVTLYASCLSCYILYSIFFLHVNICKHDDNKSYATPSKTHVARIGTSGILFTESIESKILLLMCNYCLPQFAEWRRSFSRTVDLINSFENSSFSNHLHISQKAIDWTRNWNLYYRYSIIYLKIFLNLGIYILSGLSLQYF